MHRSEDKLTRMMEYAAIFCSLVLLFAALRELPSQRVTGALISIDDPILHACPIGMPSPGSCSNGMYSTNLKCNTSFACCPTVSVCPAGYYHQQYQVSTGTGDCPSSDCIVDPSYVPPIVCGNGNCESGEDSSNCPQDCQTSLGCPAVANCASGSYHPTDTATGCPSNLCIATSTPTCGDGYCDTAIGETSTSCPLDCTSASTNITAPSNPICNENWVCTSWGTCSPLTNVQISAQGIGVQKRTCYDANSCGTTSTKPDMSRECILPSQTTNIPAPTTSGTRGVSGTLNEGASSNYIFNGMTYGISISSVSPSGVVLSINGALTSRLANGESYTLIDGSPITVTNFLYDSGGNSKVDFTLGTLSSASASTTPESSSQTTTPATTTQTETTTTQTTSTSGSGGLVIILTLVVLCGGAGAGAYFYTRSRIANLVKPLDDALNKANASLMAGDVQEAIGGYEVMRVYFGQHSEDLPKSQLLRLNNRTADLYDSIQAQLKK